MSIRSARLYVGFAILGILVFVGLSSRNPVVILSVAVIAAVAFLALGTSSWRAHRRGVEWEAAKRSARWEAASEDSADGTLIVVRRVARCGARSEVLGRQVVEELPVSFGNQDGSWDARFAEAFGRAENRAVVRNAELSR